MTTLAAQQFARVVIAMQPYVEDIVFVGGWVHALYLAEANDGGAVQTEDIDVTLPHTLLRGDPSVHDVAEQLIEAGRSYGAIEGVAASVDGRFRRLLAEIV